VRENTAEFLLQYLLLDVQAITDLKWWTQQDQRVTVKIIDLLESLSSQPFTGKGKPEALKYELSGFWARRITHRRTE